MTIKNHPIIKEHSELLNTSKILIKDISQLIDEARSFVAREYNSTQVLLCWLVGKRIDEEILKFQRAEYGEGIIVALSRKVNMLIY